MLPRVGRVAPCMPGRRADRQCRLSQYLSMRFSRKGYRGARAPRPRVLPSTTPSPLFEGISDFARSARQPSGTGNAFQVRCDFLREKRIWAGRVPIPESAPPRACIRSGRRVARAVSSPAPGHAGPPMPLCSFDQAFRGTHRFAWTAPEGHHSSIVREERAGRARGHRIDGGRRFSDNGRTGRKGGGDACQGKPVMWRCAWRLNDWEGQLAWPGRGGFGSVWGGEGRVG
jgi:hypothetical protein